MESLFMVSWSKLLKFWILTRTLSPWSLKVQRYSRNISKTSLHLTFRRSLKNQLRWNCAKKLEVNFQNLATRFLWKSSLSQLHTCELLARAPREPLELEKVNGARVFLEALSSTRFKWRSSFTKMGFKCWGSENDEGNCRIVFADSISLQKRFTNALPKWYKKPFPLSPANLLWCRTKEFPEDGSGLSCKMSARENPVGLKIGEGHCNGKQIKKTLNHFRSIHRYICWRD